MRSINFFNKGDKSDMRIHYPDYNNSTANLANSILKEFGIMAEKKPTLKLCDELLKKRYKNIVVLLLDGMGKNIMDRNLEQDGFLKKHLVGTYSSVFPPTTVAATTSIDSAKNPIEHSWLGWDCYFKEIDKNVTVFLNTESGTEKQAAEYHVAGHYLPYQRIVDKINESGDGEAYYASPFMKPYPSDFSAICVRIKKLCAQAGKKYIYAYWNEPDSTIHKKGCYSIFTKSVLKELEEKIEALCTSLEDTLVLITADHGLIDSYGVTFTDYPEIMECLVHMPSIEPRALNLFVKSGMEQRFEQLFKEAFGEKFLLITKAQVREQGLFGTGEEHPRFEEMLGDYLAIAVSDLSIYNSREEMERFIGVHAGLTEDEIVVPLVAVECCTA